MSEKSTYPAQWFGDHALGLFATVASIWYRVIPAGTLNMVYGGSQRFKTFFLLAFLRACALGAPFMGRPTTKQTCVMLAAEGGHDVHLRHAGLDQFHGQQSPILIDQARPRIDEESGFWYLMALISQATAGRFTFPELEDFETNCPQRYHTPEETTELGRLEANESQLLRTMASRYNPQNEDANAITAWQAAVVEARTFNAQIDAGAIGRYAGRDQVFQSVYAKAYAPDSMPEHGNVLLLVDTYSATSADDSKPTVARYFRHLKDLQALVSSQGGCLTVIFVDHATKNESTFQGAGDKYNSADCVFEITLRGKQRIAVKSDKSKGFNAFEDLHLSMQPVVIHGFKDEIGMPLETLVCVADTNTPDTTTTAAKAAKALTSSEQLLQIVRDHCPIHEDELRIKFLALPDQSTKVRETAEQAYRRAVAKLISRMEIEINADLVSVLED
jgi:hypothetical protein